VTPDYNRLPVLYESLKNPKVTFKAKTESERVLRTYLKSKEELKNGRITDYCKSLEELKEIEHFPLLGLVELKHLNHCTKEKPDFLSDEYFKIPENYHKSLSLKTYYEIAKKFEDPTKQIYYGLQFLPNLSVKREKISLLQELVTVARNNIVPNEYLIEVQKKLEDLSPRMSSEVTIDNMFKIAKDFESVREFEQARNYYLDIINNSNINLQEKIKAYNAYRISYKVERNLSAFLEKTGEMELYLRQLLELSPTDKALQEAWVESKINYARAIWTEHMNAEARIILDDVIISKLGSSTQRAQVFWVYGLLHLENKEKDMAIKKFELGYQITPLSPEQEENIAWSLIWTYYQTKNYKKQINFSEKILSNANNHNFRYKILFWKARAHQALNDLTEATKISEELIAVDEFGYYGLLSFAELGRQISPLNNVKMELKPSGDLTLDWLLITGEKELAQSEIRQFQKQLKTKEERKQFLPFYYYSEWFSGGMNVLLTFPQSERNQVMKEFLPVFYPILFKQEYQIATKKFKVPLAYPLAISRQESNFNPNARSWADAFGLMQLIPEKAEELSRRHSIKYSTFEDLYDPQTNIHLGVALLSDLRKKFKGQFIQSTASYNASDTVISTWTKERFTGDYLEFIENIPYEETRNYVKLVFRNFITYKRLTTDKEFSIESDFFQKEFN
jgi:soluble lytic murein transglycosylase